MNLLKPLVRGLYDMQRVRIEMGNRIVANFKVKLGQVPGKTEKEIDEDGKTILEILRLSYTRICDGVVEIPRKNKFVGDEVISEYTELCLMYEYFQMVKHEDAHFRLLTKSLEDYPIYTEFLEPIKGVGPAMAGVILSEIDIHKAMYPSSLHKYAGLDVVIKDGKGQGRSRQKHHLEQSDYVDKNGEVKQKMGITFNPFLKTKLIGVLGSSFMRQKDSEYRTIYDDYKFRLQNMPEHSEKSKGHIHNMAVRYMIKIFLINLHREWRKIEGYPATDPYHVAKLKLRDHSKVA